MKTGRKTNNNKGFSLVELLVVISIMAVALVILTISMTAVFANNVRSAASDAGSLISRGKINSNYREPYVYVMFSIENGTITGRYFEGGTTDSMLDGTDTPRYTKRLGSSAVIDVTLEGFRYGSTLDSSSPLIIIFERNTGEMKELVTAGGSEDGDGGGDGSRAEPGSFLNAEAAVIFRNANGTVYRLKLTPYTGGHEITR